MYILKDVQLISTKNLYAKIFIRKLFIIEKKFQEDDGSVDEKLQTFGFKLYEYNKLFKRIKKVKKIYYFYLLSSYFENQKYDDVIKYIKKNRRCNAFIEELPLDALGIEIKEKKKKHKSLNDD